MLFDQIHISNLLSFGSPGVKLKLNPLNVLIGPNGSGKSNFIEAISILRAAPDDITKPIRDGGGIREWMFKGNESKVADILTVIDASHLSERIVHGLQFCERNSRFYLKDEEIYVHQEPNQINAEEFIYQRGVDESDLEAVKIIGKARTGNIVQVFDDFSSTKLNFAQSILSQLKDPKQYPEITLLSKQYSKIKIYRDWSFDRKTPPRDAMRTDEFADFLDEDCSNLALVLNSLQMNYDCKDLILENLNDLYSEITDFSFSILNGTVQLFLQEGDFKIPATRLSDGTLRYLCLLAILCHPEPPPLICLEEPEIGLHPDVISSLRDLLVSASERTQLIVTTHSDILISALSEYPETVVVCEKEDGQTVMKRLDKEKMEVWLKDYSLGELWIDGQIGGNRW